MPALGLDIDMQKLAPAHRCPRWGCVVSQHDGVLSISEVATALEVSNWTVSRMIRDRELKVKRQGWKYKIPVESLRKWIFRTLGMHGAERVCMQAEKNEEISLEKSTHLAGVAGLYMAGNDPVKPENRIEPREALERLTPLLRKLAKRFSGKDRWLRDDLFQEMALAILACDEPHALSYYGDLAECRAINHLRQEMQRGIVYAPRLRLEECMKTIHATDCSKVIELFKLAQLPLSLLQLFGVYLFDEDEQKVA